MKKNNKERLFIKNCKNIIGISKPYLTGSSLTYGIKKIM